MLQIKPGIPNSDALLSLLPFLRFHITIHLRLQWQERGNGTGKNQSLEVYLVDMLFHFYAGIFV